MNVKKFPHNKTKRCPAGSTRVKGTNSCRVKPGGLKFHTYEAGIIRPKAKAKARKRVTAIPVAHAMPMQYATPIPYDLGYQTQIPTPIAYAQMVR